MVVKSDFNLKVVVSGDKLGEKHCVGMKRPSRYTAVHSPRVKQVNMNRKIFVNPDQTGLCSVLCQLQITGI